MQIDLGEKLVRLDNRKLVGEIAIGIGILCLVYFLIAIVNKISFAKFFALLGFILILYGILKIFIGNRLIFKKARWVVYIFRAALALVLISFFIIEIFIVSNGVKRDNEKVDYIVILGAMVRGETPSLMLRERLDASLNYLKSHNEIKVILSGGQGPGEKISEAEAMKRYLIKNGIEENRIIKEENSTSTMENLQFTRDRIKEIDSKKDIKLMIVTNDFHMFRAKFLAKRNDFKAYGIPANTTLPLKPANYIREYFAVIKSLIIDKSENSSEKYNKSNNIGEKIDSYKNVAVYNNGKEYTKNYGKNYSFDGYYYGYKWQCVEFIKRFYYEALGHKMPDLFGNAKDFFDSTIAHGELNKNRGLIQFKNGGKEKPKCDDLVVFNDTKYGHVGIVAEVGVNYIELIQQNIYCKSRQRLLLTEKNGDFFVGSSRKPAGWLRKQ